MLELPVIDVRRCSTIAPSSSAIVHVDITCAVRERFTITPQQCVDCARSESVESRRDSDKLVMVMPIILHAFTHELSRICTALHRVIYYGGILSYYFVQDSQLSLLLKRILDSSICAIAMVERLSGKSIPH